MGGPLQPPTGPLRRALHPLQGPGVISFPVTLLNKGLFNKVTAFCGKAKVLSQKVAENC